MDALITRAHEIWADEDVRLLNEAHSRLDELHRWLTTQTPNRADVQDVLDSIADTLTDAWGDARGESVKREIRNELETV